MVERIFRKFSALFSRSTMFSLEFKIPEKILILEVHRTVGLDTEGQLISKELFGTVVIR